MESGTFTAIAHDLKKRKDALLGWLRVASTEERQIRLGPAPEPLLPTGAAIGLMEGATFETKTAHLGPGDTIVMYTDGITEAGVQQERMYGEERLTGYLASHRGATTQRLIKDLLADVQAFTQNAPPADDTTVIVVRRRA